MCLSRLVSSWGGWCGRRLLGRWTRAVRARTPSRSKRTSWCISATVAGRTRWFAAATAAANGMAASRNCTPPASTVNTWRNPKHPEHESNPAAAILCARCRGACLGRWTPLPVRVVGPARERLILQPRVPGVLVGGHGAAGRSRHQFAHNRAGRGAVDERAVVRTRLARHRAGGVAGVVAQREGARVPRGCLDPQTPVHCQSHAVRAVYETGRDRGQSRFRPRDLEQSRLDVQVPGAVVRVLSPLVARHERASTGLCRADPVRCAKPDRVRRDDHAGRAGRCWPPVGSARRARACSTAASRPRPSNAPTAAPTNRSAKSGMAIGTGGWQLWQTVRCPVAKITGKRALCLLFRGPVEPCRVAVMSLRRFCFGQTGVNP